jgi:FAD:protein FMN transferase
MAYAACFPLMLSPLPIASRAPPRVPSSYRDEVCRARPLLGTVVEIRAASSNAQPSLHAVVDAAFAAIERVQRLMSYHDPGSDLSVINRNAAGTEQRVDAATYAVIESALRIAALSEGAFDPCVGERLERWGYLPASAATADSRREFAGRWQDVELLGQCRVRFARPLLLDLGGIAKGYAVDRAVQTLQAAGVEEISVNAGGDLRVAGARAHTIRLRHPLAPDLSAATLTLQDSALATSAAYYSRRRLPFGEVSALLDPRSSRPYVDSGCVSVRAADCMSADALTKVVLFAAPQLAERTLAACGAQALVQSPAVDPARPAGAGVSAGASPRSGM